MHRVRQISLNGMNFVKKVSQTASFDRIICNADRSGSASSAPIQHQRKLFWRLKFLRKLCEIWVIVEAFSRNTVDTLMLALLAENKN